MRLFKQMEGYRREGPAVVTQAQAARTLDVYIL